MSGCPRWPILDLWPSICSTDRKWGAACIADILLLVAQAHNGGKVHGGGGGIRKTDQREKLGWGADGGMNRGWTLHSVWIKDQESFRRLERGETRVTGEIWAALRPQLYSDGIKLS